MAPTPSFVLLGQRYILFLGAGVSATSQDPQGNRPPAWGEFLDKACNLVTAKPQKTAIKKLIKEGKLLIALQAIKNGSDQADYQNLLNHHFNNAGYIPSDLHQIIYNIDSRLLVTTNFDKIYERYCNSFHGANLAYKVLDYRSQELADEVRSDTRLIIKAHGTIDQVGNMIFTRSEYHKAKQDYPHFYDVLKSLFMTNTIVFIGCGLEDPDIMLLLEDVRVTGRHLKPHYALTKKGSRNRFLIEDWKSTYNIQVLEYGPNHSDLIGDMQNLLTKLETARAEAAGAA
ncbi:hypothetical protein BTE77_34420 [Ensifer adhaerens]|nr:hypothetical protein BTE77_34420 [Ensifer adhaerens]